VRLGGLLRWLRLALACGALPGTRAEAGEDGVELLRPGVDEVVPRTFTVEGRVTGAPGAVISVNGADVEPKDGAFSTSVTAAKDGPFNVRVLYGHPGLPATVLERRVEVDGTPPKVTVIDPKEAVGEYPTG